MKQKAIKTLLAVNDKALQDLHTILGFDFCAPLGVYWINGRYTIKQIEKHIAADGYTTENAIIAICTRRRRVWYGNDCEFQLAVINRDGVDIQQN